MKQEKKEREKERKEERKKGRKKEREKEREKERLSNVIAVASLLKQTNSEKHQCWLPLREMAELIAI